MPGQILLEEFLIPLGMTQTAFVKLLGNNWSASKLSDLISGKMTITEPIALDLSADLGTTPEFWISVQTSIELKY